MTTFFVRSLDLDDNSGPRGSDARRHGAGRDADASCEFPGGFKSASDRPGGVRRPGAPLAEPGPGRPLLVGGLTDEELAELLALGRREQEARRTKRVSEFLAAVRAQAQALGLDAATVATAVAAAVAPRTVEPAPRFAPSRTLRRRRFPYARCDRSQATACTGEGRVACAGDPASRAGE
jgi:hypothetical protein